MCHLHANTLELVSYAHTDLCSSSHPIIGGRSQPEVKSMRIQELVPDRSATCHRALYLLTRNSNLILLKRPSWPVMLNLLVSGWISCESQGIDHVQDL